jgi:hypothetical protein
MQPPSTKTAAGMMTAQQQRSHQAEKARLLFKAGRFAEALAVVKGINEEGGDGEGDGVGAGGGSASAVLHNLAVADFHRGGGRDARGLLEALLRAQARADAQADDVVGGGGAGGGGAEASNNNDHAADEDEGNGGGGGFSGRDGDRGYDTFVLRVNVAFALQELRQFARSVAVLTPLFDALEAVDDHVALRVCALLTRVRHRRLGGALK